MSRRQSIPQNGAAARRFFEQWFTAYLVRDAENEKSDGLFTGYYEPLLHGSLEKTDRYHVPLYKKPDDLIEVNLGAFRATLKGQNIAGRVEKGRLVPHHDRAEIGKGALAKKGKSCFGLMIRCRRFFCIYKDRGG